MEGIKCIEMIVPYDHLEEENKKFILDFCQKNNNVFTRDSIDGHMTSTGFVINKEHTKVLMAHHNIYNSYSWTGGHNDGDENFQRVALKEVLEETGLKEVKMLQGIVSLDCLPVKEHMKHGKLVKEHQHFNVTYVFEANELDELFIKEDENSALKWIGFDELEKWVDEKEMIVVYKKIIERIQRMNF